MKTIVVYDAEGNIKSFVIPVEDFADQIGLLPEPGCRVGYFDSGDFGVTKRTFATGPKGERPSKLPRIIEDFRIIDGKVVKKREGRG